MEETIKEETIKPDIHLAVIDETEYWNAEIVAKAGRIFGVYCFDRNVHVFCCELARSYELNFIENVWENSSKIEDENERDRIDNEILFAENELVRYVHVNDIESAPMAVEGELPSGKVGIRRLDGIVAEDSKEAIEEALEYCRCNSIV